MIPVYDDDYDIVGEVEYNDNLDFWDGSNHTCGSTGNHKGLTRLLDGRYVLIHGSQWQGTRDTAEIISAETAVREIMHSRNTGLFDEPKFSELKHLREKMIVREMGDEE